jgi:hypothetical protein
MRVAARLARDDEHALDRRVLEALEQDTFPNHSRRAGKDHFHGATCFASLRPPLQPVSVHRMLILALAALATPPTVTFGNGDPVVGLVCTETASLDMQLVVPPQLGLFPSRATSSTVKRVETLSYDAARDEERTKIEYVKDEATRGGAAVPQPLDKKTVIVVRKRDAVSFTDGDKKPITDPAMLDKLSHRFHKGGGERELLKGKTFKLGDVIPVDDATAARLWGDGYPGLRLKASQLKIGMISEKGDQARVDFKLPLAVEGENGGADAFATGALWFDVATVREVHTSVEGPVHVNLKTPASSLGPGGVTSTTSSKPPLPAISGTFSAVEESSCAAK